MLRVSLAELSKRLDRHIANMESSLTAYESFFRVVGPVLIVAITVIAIRMLSYWRSFVLHWARYRRREVVTTEALRRLDVPFVKIQVTTRGGAGSTNVILRGLRNVARLVEEDDAFYGRFLSVELVTESAEQAALVEEEFASLSIPVEALVLPPDYGSPRGTRLKARGLHYAVERRRAGWNAKPGRTFVVHYDEESVMVPDELRKLISVLSSTDKKILEGPIYYPLEYLNTTALCRAMEANRPMGCFECRHMMENGVPMHLHGSNLVVEEPFENDLGWDIGCLEGQPFIAEDYVFGLNAFLTGGPQVFGWHGCVMLEQPPFSLKSAFKQRHRWIFGVLQGVAMARGLESFRRLPARFRRRLVWGTRYRILTFALGGIVGALALAYVPLMLVHSLAALAGGGPPPLAPGLTTWLALVGMLWLGSVFVGAWCNVLQAGLTGEQRWGEIAKAVLVAPLAGMFEGSAGLWAVVEWGLGRREVAWQPTPKTKESDRNVDWRVPA